MTIQPKETETITHSTKNAATSTTITNAPEQQMIVATPPEQSIRLPDPSKGKYGPRKTLVRKPLFSKEKDASTKSSSKRTKKDD